LIYVIKNNMRFPFSKGILAKSLAITGLSLYKIYEIVIKINKKLEDSGRKELKSSEIEELVAAELLKRGYNNLERFYRLSREFAHLDKPVFILIGGGTGVGKSAISAELSHRLEIKRVISTDSIREIIRYMIPKELIPILHESSFEAGDCLKEPFVKNKLIYGFSQQVNLVSEGVLAYIQRQKEEGINTIINGVHLVPGSIKFNFKDKAAFLFHYIINLDDKKEHVRRFYLRAEESLRNPERYIDNLGKIREIQEYVNDRAKEEKVKIIENSDFKETIDIIVKDIFTALEPEVF
jgi:2-phosphoglycerate kinase